MRACVLFSLYCVQFPELAANERNVNRNIHKYNVYRLVLCVSILQSVDQYTTKCASVYYNQLISILQSVGQYTTIS